MASAPRCHGIERAEDLIGKQLDMTEVPGLLQRGCRALCCVFETVPVAVCRMSLYSLLQPSPP